MEFLKNLVAKLLGKQAGEGVTVSKAKLTAIVYVLIVAVQELSKAYGHPIVIPDFVFQFLAGAGLWSVRDAIKS